MSLTLLRLTGIRAIRPMAAFSQVRWGSGDAGSGAGKGGGTGGSIRDAGGSFGKMEVAQEDQYFRKLQQQQLESLKKHHDTEIEAHEREINRHQEEMQRLKKRIKEIDGIKKGQDSDSD